MAITLVIGERVAGTLAAGSKDTRSFSKYDIALLTRVAGQASVARDNAELHDNIQALSLTDVLTGLPNRRHLQLHLEREVAAVCPWCSLTSTNAGITTTPWATWYATRFSRRSGVYLPTITKP